MNLPIKNALAERKTSLVPAPAAAIISLIIPGLGHILARSYQRGLLLMLSMGSIVPLLYSRISQVGRRQEELLDKITRSFQLEPILILATVAVVLLYIVIVGDAYRLARDRTARNSLAPFSVVLICFFVLGWQIGDIDVGLFIREIGDAKFRLGQIMWPWARAISRDASETLGIQEIKIPCDDNPPPQSEQTPDSAWLTASPTCGNLSLEDGTRGSILTLVAGNLTPNTEVDILWQDPVNNIFRQRQGGEYITITTDENGGFELDIVMPYRLIPNSAADKSLIWKVRARQLSATGAIGPSTELLLAMSKMIETIFLGMMATLFGIVLALPLSFIAARNLMDGSSATLAIYFVVRSLLNIVRSVEPLIWAVIAVAVVGLGPFAGIVALTLHSIAALGKLYSEAIESIDTGPIEAIQATGANWIQIVIFAVIPQIIPPFVSFTIYRWDINVRLSTIIGLVGGGGIGFLLIQWMRISDFKAAGIAVWFIIITVTILDFVSSEIRHRFV